MRIQPILVALVPCLIAPACNDTNEIVVPPGGGGGPALTAEDERGVSPCPNQDILVDAGLLAAFKAALVDGLTNATFLYLDVPFDAADLDIFKKKCGLDSFWDPTASTAEVAPPAAPVTISDLYLFGNAGICAAGFDNMSFGTGEGFPVAGTYRKEFKLTSGADTYLVRVRVTVAGAAAGDTFMTRGLTVPGDLETTLGYEVDGTNQAHDDVLPALVAALQAPDASVTLDVLDMPGGATLLTALIEVIGVEQI